MPGTAVGSTTSGVAVAMAKIQNVPHDLRHVVFAEENPDEMGTTNSVVHKNNECTSSNLGEVTRSGIFSDT